MAQQKRTEQDLAKDLFLATDLSQQQIADLLDVSRRSVWLWIKNGQWEEMKLASRQAKAVIQQDIYNHITAVNDSIRQRELGDRCPTMQEVEKLRKLTGIANSMQKNHPGAYMQTFAELISYIRKQDQELASKVGSFADRYIAGTVSDKFFDVNTEKRENVLGVIDNLKKLDENSTPSVTGEPAGKPVPHDAESASACTSPATTFCDNDVIQSDNAQPSDRWEMNGNNIPGSATTLSYEENNNVNDATQYHIPDFSPDEITPPPTSLPGNPGDRPANCSCKSHLKSVNCSCKLPLSIEEIIKLPPELRPSPFRDGKILWVNNIDDAEKRVDNFGRPWGERKIGDTICRYLDVGPKTKTCITLCHTSKVWHNLYPTGSGVTTHSGVSPLVQASSFEPKLNRFLSIPLS